MGLLVEGQWHDVWYRTKSTRGRFVRKDAAFRNWITADGSAGPTRHRRLQGRSRPLPPLRQPRLPLGAPHADHAAR